MVVNPFHFPKIIPKCLTSNPLPQIVTSNPRLQPDTLFAIDMFPYKKTELFQKSGFKSKPRKKPGNTPLSSSYLSFLRTSACRRPETNRSDFAAARQSRGFSGGLRLSCSDFAYARLHWRQHVAVGRGQSPFASGSGSWASLADCASAAQTSLTLVFAGGRMSPRASSRQTFRRGWLLQIHSRFAAEF